MKNRDTHALTQLALNRKTLGGLDVFEVNAAKSRLQASDDFNKLVRILFVDFNIEHIDARELFKQYRFTFHHGLGGQGTDVAQTKHRCAIGNHTHQIAARSVAKRIGGIGNNLLARCRHTGRVRQGKIALIG